MRADGSGTDPQNSNLRLPGSSWTHRRGYMRTMSDAMSGTFWVPSVSSTRFSYSTPGGPADLYLQRRRTIVETKARGLAGDPHAPQARENNETPLQQLERYLLSELCRGQGDVRVRGACRPSVGGHPDGRARMACLGLRQSTRNARPDDPRRLCAGERRRSRSTASAPLVSGDPIGKPWVPSDPRPLFEPAHDELQAIYSELGGANLAETRTKRDLWLDMLRTASMEPENEGGARPPVRYAFVSWCPSPGALCRPWPSRTTLRSPGTCLQTGSSRGSLQRPAAAAGQRGSWSRSTATNGADSGETSFGRSTSDSSANATARSSGNTTRRTGWLA